jgi:hypothetical protein
MGAIHQLYATHCTYGSSAIERRTTGDSRDRVLGYSARASSFSPSDLRRHFRTIERFLYYYLPKETPPDKKQTLTPQAAPHRFFFCPSLSGLQALGYISYRQTDRAGRVGSYFGHVLVSAQDKNDPPWDVLECLQLWNSPGWVVEDHDTFSHGLPSLTKLSDLRGGTLPAVDERVLWSFLNTPPGGSFYCPGPLLLPDRWTRMSVADRRRYFRLALMGYLEISSKERESLLLLIEPQVAVLFFYGIARLLPAGLRAQLSFSTFETNADRLITSLAALTFDIEGNGGDVPPERYRRGFVLNTWQDRASDLQDPKAKYADFVLGSLVGVPDASAAALAHTIDQKLARFQQADAAKASDLEEFVKAHDVAEAILQLKPNVAHDAWQRSPAQTAYVRKAVRQKLSGPADPAYLTRVLNSPQYLQLMLETALQGDEDDNCTASLKYLVERVQPLDALDALLGDGGGARRYKLHALHHYVKTKGRLPGQCRWLWTEKRPVGRGPQKPQLLLELVQSSAIDAQLVRNSLNDVPDEGLPLLFRGLLKASLDQSDRNDLLTRIAGRTGFDVVTLVNDIKSELATYGALLGPVLCGPLTAILDHVHEQPGRFGEIMAALDAGKSLLDPRAASRARAWLDLKRTFEKSQQDMAAQQTSLKPVPGRKVWGFTEEVCKCLDRCFPREQYEVFRKDNFHAFGDFVRQVAATYQVGKLIPEQFDSYLIAYFNSQLDSMRRISNRGALVWFRDHPLHTAGIAAAAAMLLMVFWSVVSNQELGDGGGAPVAQAPPGDVGDKKETEQDSVAQPEDKEKAQSTPPIVDQPTPKAEPKPELKPQPEPAAPQPEPAAPQPEPAAPQPGPAAPQPEPAAPQPEPAAPQPEPAAPQPEPAAQILTARKPINNAFDRPGEAAIDILPELASEDNPFRLHGIKLAQEIPLSDQQKAAPFVSIDLGAFIKFEPQISRNTLGINARFRSQQPFPLASFDVKPGGTLSCYVTKYEPGGFDPRIVLQRDALRHCVLELKPVKDSPRLVALIKPAAASFLLDSKGGVHIQDVANPLKPNILPWGRLFLGEGKIIHPAGEFEFGKSWMQEAPGEKWPVPNLAQTLGLPEDATIELKSLGVQVRLSLDVPEPKPDRAVSDEKKKQLSSLNARKKRISTLLTVLKTARRPQDIVKASETLEEEVKPENKGPGLPRLPTPALLQVSQNKQGEAIPQYEARDAENKRRLEIYQRGLQAYETWVKDVLVPAGDKEVESLGKQIEAESPQPAEQSDGISKFHEWLKSKIQVQAYIYRLVPYDAPGEKRDIRVLVVEPGAFEDAPDLKLGPSAQ